MDTQQPQVSDGEAPSPPRQLRMLEARHPCYLHHLEPLSVNLYDEIVKVIVGEEDPKTFHVHRGLLAFHCSYFAGAFNGQFLEAQTRTIMLDQDDPETFQLVYNFLYTGRFGDGIKDVNGCTFSVPILVLPKQLTLCLSSELLIPDPHAQDVIALSFKQLLDLHVFADMRGAPRMLDTTLSLLLAKIANELQIPIDWMADAAEFLPVDAPLKRMFAFLIAMCASRDSVDDHNKRLSHSLLVKIFAIQRKAMNMLPRSSNTAVENCFIDISACAFHKGTRCKDRLFNQHSKLNWVA